MANHYTQWSEYISFNNKEEADWLKDVLFLDISKYETPENEDLDNAEIVQEILSSNFGIELRIDDADNFPGFERYISNDRSGVSIYAEEYGDVSVAAIILQAFLKKFRPNDHFSIQWADTCSKPRAGEFGGGAVFITAKKLEWMYTSNWINERITDFEKSNSSSR